MSVRVEFSHECVYLIAIFGGVNGGKGVILLFHERSAGARGLHAGRFS